MSTELQKPCLKEKERVRERERENGKETEGQKEPGREMGHKKQKTNCANITYKDGD